MRTTIRIDDDHGTCEMQNLIYIFRSHCGWDLFALRPSHVSAWVNIFDPASP
jgi:hypothetical protein